MRTIDVSVITQLVSSVGFPIVACGAIAYLFYREQNLHKDESSAFTDAINSVNVTLQKLTDKLEKGEESNES